METENVFLVLKDEQGVFRPMAFIARDNEIGKMSAENYKSKVEEGEQIVKVFISEI